MTNIGPKRRKGPARRSEPLVPLDASTDAAPGISRRSGQLRRSLPPPRRRRGSDQVLAALGLLVVGAVVALGIQRLAEGPAPSASSAPSTAPSDDTGDLPSDDAGASDGPDESVAPVSPILEARMPTTISGVTLTIQSAADATSLSNGPNGRALNAAVVHLGKQASDLEIALAYDGAGSLDLTIIGFRANGVDAATMRTAVLEAWLAAGTPGVTTSSVTLSGTAMTKISYGDGGDDEYVLTVGDGVFVLETSDTTLAQSAASAITGTATAPSFTPAPIPPSAAPTSTTSP